MCYASSLRKWTRGCNPRLIPPFRAAEPQINWLYLLSFPQHCWSSDNAFVPPSFFCRRVVLSHQQRYASNRSVTQGETADVVWSFLSSKPIGEPLLPSFCRKTQPGARQWHGELKSGSTVSNPEIRRLDLRTGNSILWSLSADLARGNTELWAVAISKHAPWQTPIWHDGVHRHLLPLRNSEFCDTSTHIQTYGHNLRGISSFNIRAGVVYS